MFENVFCRTASTARNIVYGTGSKDLNSPARTVGTTYRTGFAVSVLASAVS
jgi:hypothetical protein